MKQKRQQDAEKALVDQTNVLPRGQLLIVFAGLASSVLICFMDQNGISVMLPTIGRQLNAEDTISWAGTSSLIANTMFTVLYGRLSDIFGRKVVFMAALALLCIADLLCGLSQNAAMFYVFRGLAGVAGGGASSLTMIIVSDVVTLKARGKYQGILGSCVGTGNVIGPFIAAAFVQKSTWRGYFYMISPLVACCAIIAYFLLPNNMRKEGMRKNASRIDFLGILASSVAIIFLLIPISGGGAYFPWSSPMVISMLVIGGCALIAFILIEWKVATLPMLPMVLFRNRVISTLFLQNFLLGAVYQSYLYYLPLYFQNVRQWPPIESAAMAIPTLAMQSIASILSGQYISRRKRYGEVIWAGFALWTLGSGLTILFSRTTNRGVIAIILILIGTGVGFTFQPSLVALQAHCTKSQRAVVISNRNFFRCMGGAVGLAVSAAVLQATLQSNLPAGYKQLARLTYAVPPRGSVPVAADWEGTLDAYMKASRAVFILQTPLIAVCLVGCVLIRDRGLERPKEPGEVDADAEQQKQNAENNNAATEVPAAAVAVAQEKQLEEGEVQSQKGEKETASSTPQPSRPESRRSSLSLSLSRDVNGTVTR